MKYDEAGLKAVLQDGRYQNIGNLPSNFYPYKDFTELYIRPFTVKELRLVSKAAMLGDMTHLIRAIDLVTTQDAATLSIGDFHYVLMWLRIHSMPKTPYVVEWHCKEPVVTHKENGQRLLNDDSFKLPPEEDQDNWDVFECKTHNSEVIHMTNVEIITLDEDNFDGIPQNGLVKYDFPRAHLIGQVKDMLKEDPTMKMIVGCAMWISDEEEIEKNGKMVKAITLEDKIAVLENQNDLEAFDFASVINEEIIHGIAETTTLTCRNCLKQTAHTLIFDALSFFR